MTLQYFNFDYDVIDRKTWATLASIGKIFDTALKLAVSA